MICFVIYAVNVYVKKYECNSFEKHVWYSNDFGWFLWKFSMILADFLLPGSGSVYWSGSGSGWPKWNGSKRIRIRNTDLNIRYFLPDMISHMLLSHMLLSMMARKAQYISYLKIISHLHSLSSDSLFCRQLCCHTCCCRWQPETLIVTVV